MLFIYFLVAPQLYATHHSLSLQLIYSETFFPHSRRLRRVYELPKQLLNLFLSSKEFLDKQWGGERDQICV